MASRSQSVRLLSRLAGPLTTSRRPKGLRVLLYHSIAEGGAGRPGLSVSVETFLSQMRWLTKESGLEVVGLEQGVERLSSRTSNPLVAVTFDDGFRDTLTAAAPILRSLHIPFTVFVTAAHFERVDAASPYLNAGALRELAAVEGCTIGAHGYSHRPLTRIPEPELERELLGAKEELERCIGRPVSTLSYPHGAVNPRVCRAAAARGFHLGATSFIGVNGPETAPLMLRRTEILDEDGMEGFQLKLRGGYDWYALKQRLYWPVPAR